MATVTVSKKGWVVIPKEIRERHGIKEGDKVRLIDSGGRILLVPAGKDPISEGRGLLKDGTSMKEYLADKRRELEAEEQGLPAPEDK